MCQWLHQTEIYEYILTAFLYANFKSVVVIAHTLWFLNFCYVV